MKSKRKEEIKSLLYYFIIPVVMIAWPSIQSIKFSETVVEINKATQELEKDPNNEVAKKDLQENLNKVDLSRAENNPDLLLEWAKGANKIGNYKKALEFVNEYLKLKPDNSEAVQLKTDLQKKLITSPKPEEQVDTLRILDSLYQRSLGAKNRGHYDKALEFIEAYLKLKPNDPKAIKLKKNIIDLQ